MLLNNLRIDGRKLQQIRNIEIDHQYIENILCINFKQGQTEIAVFLQPNTERKIFFTITNNYQPEKEYRFFVYRLNEIFQFNFIDFCKMNIEIIRDGGSLFSTMVNSISMAAIIGGIQMKDIFVGSTVGYFKNKVFFDISDFEQQNKIMKIDSVFSANSLENYYFYFKGDLSLNDIQNIYSESKKCTILIKKQIEKYLKNLI